MGDELPSVDVTKRFLSLCEHFGSQRAAVGTVALGRKRGVPGVPAHDDWTSWNAGEMRAAVEYLRSTHSMSRGGRNQDPETLPELHPFDPDSLLRLRLVHGVPGIGSHQARMFPQNQPRLSSAIH